MTLIIASKTNNHISFASDSRIHFGGNKYVDFGVKVFSIPVKIDSPAHEKTGETECVYNHSIGLMVAGNTNNAFTLKESLQEMLQNLQFLPSYTDLSMEGIVKFVFKVYSKISQDLYKTLGAGEATAIIGGYCLIEKKIRVFKLFSIENEDEGEIKTDFTEILLNNEMEFAGSGKVAGVVIHNTYPELNSLRILKRVIQSEEVISVGGGLQYGEFQGTDFRIFGIFDHTIDEYQMLNPHHTLRGLNIYEDDLKREFDGYHVHYAMKDPFEKERNEHLDNVIKGRI